MKKFLINTITILYFIIAIVLTVFLLSYNEYKVTQIGNYMFIVSVDEEVDDVAQKGDLIVVKKERNKSKNIKKGDKIFFYTKQDEGMVISAANIIKKEQTFGAGGEYSYIVEGNIKISEKYIIGKATNAKTIPYLGTTLNILESKLAFLFLVVFPTFIIFLYEAYKVVMEVKYGAFEDME